MEIVEIAQRRDKLVVSIEFSPEEIKDGIGYDITYLFRNMLREKEQVIRYLLEKMLEEDW